MRDNRLTISRNGESFWKCLKWGLESTLSWMRAETERGKEREREREGGLESALSSRWGLKNTLWKRDGARKCNIQMMRAQRHTQWQK